MLSNSSKLLLTIVLKTQKRKNQTEILLPLHYCFLLNRSSLCAITVTISSTSHLIIPFSLPHQAIVDQCAKNTTENQSKDFDSPPLFFSLEPFFSLFYYP
jgi:hypothetical protein